MALSGMWYFLPMNTDTLFEPLKIGEKLTLKNRVVMAPMTTISGEADGRFSQQEIDYLSQRAKTGIGLIMTPACYCHKSGHSFDHQVGCHTDAMLERLGECADGINRAGSASFLQIHHGGNAAKQEYTGDPPWAPSAVLNRRGTSEMPQAMTEQQIWTVIDAFARAAERAVRAGFTGIELHGANTYLFQQFFSPFTNKRDDQWGAQSFENRRRFAIETVRAVREAVGPVYPICYRISPEEEDPGGYSTTEAIELLKHLIAAGVDMVHVSAWSYGKYLRGDLPAGVHPTLAIRQALPNHIPVIGVGSIYTPQQAQRVLDDGVDLVALGRALLLNADWFTKALDGRIDEIRTELESEEERASLQIPGRMKEYTKRFFVLD